MAVSDRVKSHLSFEFQLKDVWQSFSNNAYDEILNNKGIINVLLSHNSSVSDLIVEKLNQTDLQKWDESMLPYTPERSGTLRLRKAMGEFLTHQFSAIKPLDPEKFSLMNSVTSGLNMLAYVLCNDGDTILSPSPVYGAIPRDFLFCAGVKTYKAFLRSEPEHADSQPYELTTDLLQSALTEAREKNHNVKALLLVNPVNPFGTVYTREQILDYLQFCKMHDLHCIVDEIYGCSVYDPSIKFTSVLSFDPDQLPDKNRTHVLWGMSKDFGMPGNPIGAVYTWNKDVTNGLATMIDFNQIPHFNQISAAKLLEDKDWLQNVYLPTMRRRLDESSQITMEALDDLGVAYIKPSAGLFIYANFRKYLPEPTSEAEIKLCSHLLENGVAIAPSSAFYAGECGWFRIIFSVRRNRLVEAMRRLREACRNLPWEK